MVYSVSIMSMSVGYMKVNKTIVFSPKKERQTKETMSCSKTTCVLTTKIRRGAPVHCA